MHCGAKSRCESKSALVFALKSVFYQEKLRKPTINDPGPYIYIYIYIYLYIYIYMFIEHLKDLEHGPPPEGGNVILDEFFK